MKKVLRFRVAACVVFLLCIATATVVSAQTFTTLVSFDGTASGNPQAPLVQAVDGNLYGTNYGAGGFPLGSLFKITPTGALTTEFLFGPGDSGAEPQAGMILANDGSLYGTTTYGGNSFWGTAFQFSPRTDAVTTIYNFCSQTNCADGVAAHGLIQAADGNFYGTANHSFVPPFDPGIVFRLTPAGVLTTLYTFCSETNCIDGWDLFSGVVQGGDGNFYGTSWNGGDYNEGTVFKLTPAGVLTSLYNFTLGAGGEQPSGLIQAADGILFGATATGGANGGGTVFKITTSGVLNTLYSFCAESGCADGSSPGRYSALIQGSDGNFYGSTSAGGSSNDGTIFKITSGGVFTTLHSFNGADGAAPLAGLMQATNGSFYGTTSTGGAGGYGTVLVLTTGLAPFAKTVPTVGHVGTPVILLGNGLTGATSVTFNGTAATFTVASSTEIKTTVPTGATSGKVQVTTPHGTLTSNAAFQVK